MTIHVGTWTDVADGLDAEATMAAARERLLTIEWLANIGQPSDRDHEVDRVDTIDDALAMFGAYLQRERRLAGVGANGTLARPADALLAFADQHPDLYAAPNAAAHAALDAMGNYHGTAGAAIAARMGPDVETIEADIAAGDYVTDYVRFLFLEIAFGDRLATRSTYFRDQLAWWVAGFFPCGWSGSWPEGRLRIF